MARVIAILTPQINDARAVFLSPKLKTFAGLYSDGVQRPALNNFRPGIAEGLYFR
jgi:hypothetical protein